MRTLFAGMQKPRNKRLGMAYLVRLMIVLRIILKHLRLLLVIKVLDQIVYANTAKVFPPFLAFDEPRQCIST
jgi:hypothetical protein